MSFFVDQNEMILNSLENFKSILISILPPSKSKNVTDEFLILEESTLSSIKNILFDAVETKTSTSSGGEANNEEQPLPERELLEKRVKTALLFLKYVKHTVKSYSNKVPKLDADQMKNIVELHIYNGLLKGFFYYIQHVIERIIFHNFDSSNTKLSRKDVEMMAMYYKILCDLREHMIKETNEETEVQLLVKSVENFLMRIKDVVPIDDEKMKTIEESSGNNEEIKEKGTEVYQTLRETLDSIDIQSLHDSATSLSGTQKGNKSSGELENCQKDLKRYNELLNNLIDQLNAAIKIRNQIDHDITNPVKTFNQNIINLYTSYRDNEFKDSENYLLSLKDIEYTIPEEYDSIICPKVKTELDNLEKYKKIKQQMINFKEDLLGAVRVFIKVKPISKIPNIDPTQYYKRLPIKYPRSITNIQDENAVLNIEGNKYIKLANNETKGPFFNVFKPEKTNQDVFTEMRGMFDQILNGYHIVIFGYGYSGAGKTFSLLNKSNDQDKGILLNAIEYFNSNSINIVNIFELYIDNLTIINNKPNLKGKRIDLNNPYYADIHSDINEFNSQNENKTDGTFSVRTEIFSSLVKNITSLRVAEGRIKKTINNPESSRSHLFITLQIDGGAITICDMGGRESPEDIFRNTQLRYGNKSIYISPIDKSDTSFFTSEYLSTSMLFNMKKTAQELSAEQNKPGKLGKYIREVYKKKNDDKKDILIKKDKLNNEAISLLQTCFEGYYINETVNHLTWYFNMLNSVSIKVNTLTNFLNYTTDSYFTDPNSDSSSQILMIQTLHELNDLLGNNDTKPTKFVMLACIRSDDEPKFVEFSQNTLEFAENISSTIGISEYSQTQKRLPGIAAVALSK
jgi:hypothetical protein